MRFTAQRRSEHGQVLVIFALGLVATIAMVGLVLDGGSALVQRRTQQNVADAAAMAGAYAWLNGGTSADAVTAARTMAASNGYTHGTGDVVVDVSTGTGVNGANLVSVVVGNTHRNYFAGIVGMPTWAISAEASAQAGAPNAARGPMPLLFNQDAFPAAFAETTFGEPAPGSGDIPLGHNQFNWTVYCLASGTGGCNADTRVVEDIIQFENKRDTEVVVGVHKISPLNAGSHSKLFSYLAAHVGGEFPVSIVDDSGTMVGWAMFHVTGSVGGSTKTITGYFIEPINTASIYISAGGGGGNSAFGAFEVKLVD